MLLASPGLQGDVGGLCGNNDGDPYNDNPALINEEYFIDVTYPDTGLPLPLQMDAALHLDTNIIDQVSIHATRDVAC